MKVDWFVKLLKWKDAYVSLSMNHIVCRVLTLVGRVRRRGPVLYVAACPHAVGVYFGRPSFGDYINMKSIRWGKCA
jgi:hypothetical protein